MESLKQNYRQRYCRILKWWNFKSKITGIYIAKLSRGGISKMKLQAEILQNYQEVAFKNKIKRRYIEELSRGGIY